MDETTQCPPPYDEPKCPCSKHTMIIKPGNENVPCEWDEAPQIIMDLTSAQQETHVIAIVSVPEFKLLFEEAGFMIETPPDDGNNLYLFNSWVTHYCPSKHWKVTIYEEDMLTHGVCRYCSTHVPPGIIALWKLHNWNDLQTGQTYGEQKHYVTPA